MFSRVASQFSQIEFWLNQRNRAGPVGCSLKRGQERAWVGTSILLIPACPSPSPSVQHQARIHFVPGRRYSSGSQHVED